MSIVVAYTASSQDLDSVRCVATEIAIEDFLHCRLSREADEFSVYTELNRRGQFEISIMRRTEEQMLVVDPATGSLRKHSYRRCVERDGKLFYWRSDTMTNEDFELLDKYGVLYYAKDSVDYDMKLWESVSVDRDNIEAAQYFFCTSNPKNYKRRIDVYPQTVKLRCRKRAQRH